MLSFPGRLASLFLVAACLTAHAQAPPAGFLPNYPAAQQTAKKSGLPVMAVVTGKGNKAPDAIADARVTKKAQAFVGVLIPADGPAAKKLDGAAAGAVLFLTADGEALGHVDAGFKTEQLLDEMAKVADQARGKLADRIKDGKETGAKALLEGYAKLGANAADLAALLPGKSADVRAAIRTQLAAKTAEGADWAVLNVLASPDADAREAAYPIAAELAKAPKLKPAKFWKEAGEDERAAELDRWREAVFGKVPPANKLVLDFCVNQYGRQVTRGECAELAADAFKFAKAQPMKPDGKTYVWGKPLAKGEAALPGDIVQLEDAKFSNGVSAPHHTQVVRKVLGPGQYEVLEQNVSGRRTVGTGKLTVGQLTAGTLVIYRPQSADGEKK